MNSITAQLGKVRNFSTKNHQVASLKTQTTLLITERVTAEKEMNGKMTHISKSRPTFLTIDSLKPWNT